MREFKTFIIHKEMPTKISRQISIPDFMLAEKPQEVKSHPILGIIQGITFITLCYSFMGLDRFPAQAWVGMTVSLVAFTLASVWRD